MDNDRLHQTLLRAARSESYAPRIPADFGERVMRAVWHVRRDEALEVWACGLWRAALSSAGIAALVTSAALFVAGSADHPPGRPRWPLAGWDAAMASGDHGGPFAIDDLSIDDLLIHDLESGDLR